MEKTGSEYMVKEKAISDKPTKATLNERQYKKRVADLQI